MWGSPLSARAGPWQGTAVAGASTQQSFTAKRWTAVKASSLAHVPSGPNGYLQPTQTARTQGEANLKLSARRPQRALGPTAPGQDHLSAASTPSLTSRAEALEEREATPWEGGQRPVSHRPPCTDIWQRCPQLCSCRKCLLPPLLHASRALKNSFRKNAQGRPSHCGADLWGTSSATCGQGQMFLPLRTASPAARPRPGARPLHNGPPTQSPS